MVGLTQRQRRFLAFLREHAGETVSVDEVRSASGLSEKSWTVYMNAGRYSPYLVAAADGRVIVTGTGTTTDSEFYEQVRQTKQTGPLTAAKANHVYRLEPRPLGQGGFALVHRGRHRSSGEIHAVKVPKPGDENAERLRREICVMRELEHEYIMPLLDHDEEFGWYAMPVAEKSLLDMPVLTSQEVRAMVMNVAAGLQHGHAQKLVHRDVTPGNILFLGGVPGRWVLADWGTVRRPTGQTTMHQTRTGQLLGTEAFAPLELWQDAHGADERADIYALGRVVAWALGRRSLIPNIVQLVAGEWAEFVEEATRPSREARPANMDALLLLVPHSVSGAATATATAEQDRFAAARAVVAKLEAEEDSVQKRRRSAVLRAIQMLSARLDDLRSQLRSSVADAASSGLAITVVGDSVDKTSETLLMPLTDRATNSNALFACDATRATRPIARVVLLCKFREVDKATLPLECSLQTLTGDLALRWRYRLDGAMLRDGAAGGPLLRTKEIVRTFEEWITNEAFWTRSHI